MRKRFLASLTVMVLLMGILVESIPVNAKSINGIKFRNITIEDGLSQATVETIIQDSKGYIWIGTNDGLSRFNGYNYKLYRNDRNTKNSLVNNYIVDLKEDHDGNIWVGTANGVSKIHSNSETITNYTTNPEQGNLSNYNVGDILVKDDGSVLVGTSDGLNLYNKETDSFERIHSDTTTLQNQLIYSLDEDELGNIWIGTKSGLYQINKKTDKVEAYTTTEGKSVIDDSIYKVFCDENNLVWVGTYNSGLARIDTNTGDIKTYSHDVNNDASLPGNFVRNFLRDSRGKLWICTNSGLSFYDEKTEQFNTYNNKLYDRHSLVADDTFVIMEDNAGLMWAGTYAGISIFDAENKIQHYKRDPFDSNSLNDNMIQGIYEDSDGFVWLGTNSKGINILDRTEGTVKHINTKATPGVLSNDSINDITGDGNTIFVATDNGLNILSKDTNKVKVYTEEDGLNDNKVKSVYLDTKGNLWVGTVNGFNIIDLKEETVIDLNPIFTKYNILDNYSGAIFEDSDGIYWLGSFIDGGLTKLDHNEQTLTNYKYIEGDNTSITDNSIKAINEDAEGNLWIGTSLGLNKFDKKTEEFVGYSIQDGLPSNNIYGILFDDYENPWVSTNMGISKYDKSSNTFTNLNVNSGLQSNEFNGESYFENKNGEFYFGGINGLNIFNPSDIINNQYIPQVVFDEFKVNGVEHSDINEKSFKETENTINIQVFLPDYKSGNNIQYYYMLEGGTDDWTLMETNEVVLSNLSSGFYTFNVKARNSNGVLSDVNSVEFTIEPPFWKSGNAMLFYVICIVVIILEYRNRVKKLDAMVTFRTRELCEEGEKNKKLFNKIIDLEKKKNNYFVNLSHELRTPLNVLSSTEQLITELNKKEEGIERTKLAHYMDISSRNIKRLLKIINDLIDTSKIENGNYNLNIKSNNIIFIVEEATLAMKDYVESKGITLIIDPEIEEKIIECDALEIERCIVNLVGNAAKFTPENGIIEVKILDLWGTVRIEVIDNGVGIDKVNHQNIFDRFNQIVDVNSEVKGGSGLGLTITKNIIDLHNGEIYVESELNKGSKFVIILPVSIK